MSNQENIRSGTQIQGQRASAPCMVKGTAESGIRKDAAYTFIPHSAVTVAAPPRISIAVTITAETKRHNSQLGLKKKLQGFQSLTLGDDDEGDVGDMSRRAPSSKSDLAHGVDGRAPEAAMEG